MTETRRGVAALAARLLAAAAVLSSGVSAWLMTRKRPVPPTPPVRVGTLEDLAAPNGSAVQFVPEAEVFVVRSADTIAIAGARCTHQFCLLKFAEEEKLFACPCHGSLFDLNGNVLRGPAIAPLVWYRPDVDETGALTVVPSETYPEPQLVPVSKS